MARSNKKRKKTGSGTPQLSPRKYIIQNAGNLPKGIWYINSNWQEDGLAAIWASRIMPSGNLIIGLFLVDLYCLGIKQTNSIFNMKLYAVEKEVAQHYTVLGLQYIEVNPDLAQNIIYGANEYAENLGFTATNEFDLTEYILDPADEVPYINLTFGKNGRPYYVAGPYDNFNYIMGVLDKSVGPDGYESMVPLSLEGFEYDDEDQDNDGYEDDEDEDFDDDGNAYTDYEDVDNPNNK